MQRSPVYGPIPSPPAVDGAARPFNAVEDQELKIIGVELRLVDCFGQSREVAMFGGLDIRIPRGNYNARSRFNVTVHTSLGDSTSMNQDLPA